MSVIKWRSEQPLYIHFKFTRCTISFVPFVLFSSQRNPATGSFVNPELRVSDGTGNIFHKNKK